MVEQLSTLRYVNGRQHLHEFFKEKLEGRTEEQYNLDSLMVTLFGEVSSNFFFPASCFTVHILYFHPTLIVWDL